MKRELTAHGRGHESAKSERKETWVTHKSNNLIRTAPDGGWVQAHMRKDIRHLTHKSQSSSYSPGDRLSLSCQASRAPAATRSICNRASIAFMSEYAAKAEMEALPVAE
mmetsp:Transcript_2992/g.9148  ORF Transcript_2992/g.9148 Transcript_2992/m.9148 type:complete len:109 (-) Transcript_2992:560-886(-)|eukprot:scaffold210878_cov32-Tisochrysis_lutea.AAC.2